ncbi:MIT domain-containing protein 1-like [Megachile rotundata]|uniref:MIT domain-containing protein 1-like n=1 Tax=Megachile rotundata TaxID=143995 RepID=UPI000258E0C8|nr:PREDICTED: MIT domain-containing protein 1-like isoform X2 [Megachile rotundata]XP_012140851.1 PREDICTED: MIT domain-containing protein 1-like isoform X2 [Megachile rotundata]XP_012140852.1 PREDICTED: MIT domain-containing protein 1-like isoform X2 [Megachile rotundata]XP_012140853.1 PREDICTED: MIT domain-containing protein 1-like isoform X2 [Megachile rotundata]
MENAAASILKRAVEKDNSKQYTMALVLYQEGVQILLDSMKETRDSARQKHFATKASEYLDRAEKIKSLIEKEKAAGTYRELIKIENGSIGHGYGTVFGRFLDATVTYIHIEDPYIRAFHQCQNLVRLCELAVKKCHALSKISLVTTVDVDDRKNQKARLEELKQSLMSHLISFEFQFSDTLHDRQILFSNGWIVKIGRGLDYFKAPDGKFVLGACDLELRPCLETIIDIFHKQHLKTDIT